MPRPNGNFILSYIFLVGLPLLALIGVLRVGGKLAAPVSLDGVWSFDTEPGGLATLMCRPSAAAPNTSFSIRQSGKQLVLAADNGAATGRGTVDGRTITASFALTASRANDPSCMGAHGLTLNASVDTVNIPRAMVGTLSAEGCLSCLSIKFHAVRQAGANGGSL